MSIRRRALVGAILMTVVVTIPGIPGAAQGPSAPPSPSPSAAPASPASPAPSASLPLLPQATPFVGGPRWAPVRARAVRRAGMLEHAVTLGEEVIALAPTTTRHGGTRLRVLASPDGSHWTRRGGIPMTGDVADLVADGATLYAVGWDERATIWRSDDAGRTWSTPVDGAPFAGGADGRPALDEGAQVEAIARGPAGLVAVGSVIDPDKLARRGAAWRSDDGLAWVRIAEAGALPPLHDLAADTTTYVALGSSIGAAESPMGADVPVLRWSVDGVTWTDAGAPIGSRESLLGVTALPEAGFLAWGRPLDDQAAPAVILTSADGRTWSRMPDDPTLAEARLAEVRALDGGAVTLAVGGLPTGAHVFTDVAGTWRRTPVRPGGAMCIRDIASVRAILVAVGGTCGAPRQHGRAWTSPLEP